MSAPLPTDFEWPPGSGKFWRPGPVFQSRWLGVWPEISEGVWSEALWRAVEVAKLELPSLPVLPRIGCDVAEHGTDWTCFHLRWGSVSIRHFGYNGKDLMETVGNCVTLADEAAALCVPEPGHEPIKATTVMIAVDDDGLGGGVRSRLRELGYNVRGVGASASATNSDKYPNMRSELWFAAMERAREAKLDLSRIPVDTRHKIKAQAMAPTWRIDSAGRRVVEPKADTKKKIGRSPDDMDAMNLAYIEIPGWSVPDPKQLQSIKASQQAASEGARRFDIPSHAAARGYFGRG